ncbi:MAG: molecular chaperone HtpG, partial [Solobacterium sp.]|nr:molecular chaperone HtpG [Solobacterium sp.]
EKKEKEKATEENKELLDKVKEILGDKVEEVVISTRLDEDPVCIVAKDGLSLEMERYMANDPLQKGQIKAKKVLELNPKHALFEKLKNTYDKKEDIQDLAEVLYTEALLIQGLPIEDPLSFTKKLTNLLINK